MFLQKFFFYMVQFIQNGTGSPLALFAVIITVVLIISGVLYLLTFQFTCTYCGRSFDLRGFSGLIHELCQTSNGIVDDLECPFCGKKGGCRYRGHG